MRKLNLRSVVWLSLPAPLEQMGEKTEARSPRDSFYLIPKISTQALCLPVTQTQSQLLKWPCAYTMSSVSMLSFSALHLGSPGYGNL